MKCSLTRSLIQIIFPKEILSKINEFRDIHNIKLICSCCGCILLYENKEKVLSIKKDYVLTDFSNYRCVDCKLKTQTKFLKS